MNTKHPRRFWFSLLLFGLGSFAPLHAACVLSTVSVAFGAYDPLSGNATDSVGSVQVDCTPSAAYTLALSAGQGSYAARHLVSGLNTLDYNLYTDPARSTVWGDGSAGTVIVSGSASSALHSIYGRIPGGQIQVGAGTYADSIIVTVEF